MAGNVDPTPPRPPKAPAKPVARLALTSYTTSAIPVAAPAAVPGTVSVPRRPSTIQSVVPVGADDDKRERRTISNCPRSRTRRRHRISHHRHHHRDHYSPRSTPRSESCRSVGTAPSVSQVRGPPPGQWDIHTSLWDPYVGNITRHGPDEAALRALSEGRFVGIICAKSVAESVFGSQILKTLRDQGIDIDATAESLHRQLAPQQGIPNRTDTPIEFMAPFVQFIADKLKAQCPVKQDTAAMRKLQETEAKLQAAKTKLAQAGILDTPQRSRRTTGTFAPDPKLPTDDDDGPGSASSVVSVSLAVVSTSLRKRSTEALGASPKALPKQRKLAPMFNKAAASPKDVTSATQSPTQLTIQEILEPKAPNLRENQLSGTTAANVKKWTQNFNLEAQQMSKKIMDIIKAAKCTKEQLQRASTQYGLNLSDVLKLSIISLQQAVPVGAAVTA